MGQCNSDVKSLELVDFHQLRTPCPTNLPSLQTLATILGVLQNYPYFRATGYKFRGSSYLLKFDNSPEWLVELRKALYLKLSSYYKGYKTGTAKGGDTDEAQEDPTCKASMSSGRFTLTAHGLYQQQEKLIRATVWNFLEFHYVGMISLCRPQVGPPRRSRCYHGSTSQPSNHMRHDRSTSWVLFIAEPQVSSTGPQEIARFRGFLPGSGDRELPNYYTTYGLKEHAFTEA